MQRYRLNGNGQIVTLHKEKDQKDCKNYRRITVLCTTYTIVLSINRKLVNITKSTMEKYERGLERKE